MTDMEEKSMKKKNLKIVICGGGSTYTARDCKKSFGRGRIKIKRIMVI